MCSSVVSYCFKSILVECSIFPLRSFVFPNFMVVDDVLLACNCTHCCEVHFPKWSTTSHFRSLMVHKTVLLLNGIWSSYLERNLQFMLHQGLLSNSPASLQSVSDFVMTTKCWNRWDWPGLGVLWWKSPSIVLLLYFGKNLCHFAFPSVKLLCNSSFIFHCLLSVSFPQNWHNFIF